MTTSSQTSLAPGSSVIIDNGDSDVDETSISPLLTSQFKKKKRTSKIWDHTPFGRNQIVRNTEGQIIWRCKYCKGKPAEYLGNGGTAHIYKPLKSLTTLDILSLMNKRLLKQGITLRKPPHGYLRTRIPSNAVDTMTKRQILTLIDLRNCM
ncbi:hypothetical protein FOFC_18062 [Fusarium oxysporum]|nr:hypothetical protein FOFC_18062 [Fusarium oxysporum]